MFVVFTVTYLLKDALLIKYLTISFLSLAKTTLKSRLDIFLFSGTLYIFIYHTKINTSKKMNKENCTKNVYILHLNYRTVYCPKKALNSEMGNTVTLNRRSYNSCQSVFLEVVKRMECPGIVSLSSHTHTRVCRGVKNTAPTFQSIVSESVNVTISIRTSIFPDKFVTTERTTPP